MYKRSRICFNVITQIQCSTMTSVACILVHSWWCITAYKERYLSKDSQKLNTFWKSVPWLCIMQFLSRFLHQLDTVLHLHFNVFKEITCTLISLFWGFLRDSFSSFFYRYSAGVMMGSTSVTVRNASWARQ